MTSLSDLIGSYRLICLPQMQTATGSLLRGQTLLHWRRPPELRPVPSDLLPSRVILAIQKTCLRHSMLSDMLLANTSSMIHHILELHSSTTLYLDQYSTRTSLPRMEKS